jgi:hypothetical protein
VHVYTWQNPDFFPKLPAAEYSAPGQSLGAHVRAGWLDIPWCIWRPAVLRWGLFLLLIAAGMAMLAQALDRVAY